MNTLGLQQEYFYGMITWVGLIGEDLLWSNEGSAPHTNPLATASPEFLFPFLKKKIADFLHWQISTLKMFNFILKTSRSCFRLRYFIFSHRYFGYRINILITKSCQWFMWSVLTTIDSQTCNNFGKFFTNIIFISSCKIWVNKYSYFLLSAL